MGRGTDKGPLQPPIQSFDHLPTLLLDLRVLGRRGRNNTQEASLTRGLGFHCVQGGQKMLGAEQEAPEPLWFLKGENLGTSHAVGHLLFKKHKVARVSEAVGTRGRRAGSAGMSTGAASMEQRGGCSESYRRNHRRPRRPRFRPCPWED